MPRVRGSEMAPRVSTTRGAPSLRTSSSDSDPPHHRSPKLGDRRSPRSAHSEPLNQKKLGTRIAGLETQLEQAQGELKILKDQLASAEAAKKEAQKELEKKAVKTTIFVPAPTLTSVPVLEPVPASTRATSVLAPMQMLEPVSVSTRTTPVLEPVPVQDTRSPPRENEDSGNETDVFEVPIEMARMEGKVEESKTCDQDEVKVNVSGESQARFEEAIAVKNEEISSLKLTIEAKEKAIESSGHENDLLKGELTEANAKIASAMVNEEKLTMKLTKMEEEFRKSKTNGIELKERLEEVEGAKEALETEMKKLRVQTEQWRKAADAAAAILAGGEGRRVSERCGSMDKQHHYGGVFEGFVGSPPLGDELDDGKRKGSGIRMFGDLWKKKGHK